ncbi:hypothetical protein Tco_1260803 [Tanacetum coccineum]
MVSKGGRMRDYKHVMERLSQTAAHHRSRRRWTRCFERVSEQYQKAIVTARSMKVARAQNGGRETFRIRMVREVNIHTFHQNPEGDTSNGECELFASTIVDRDFREVELDCDRGLQGPKDLYGRRKVVMGNIPPPRVGGPPGNHEGTRKKQNSPAGICYSEMSLSLQRHPRKEGDEKSRRGRINHTLND